MEKGFVFSFYRIWASAPGSIPFVYLFAFAWCHYYSVVWAEYFRSIFHLSLLREGVVRYFKTTVKLDNVLVIPLAATIRRLNVFAVWESDRLKCSTRFGPSEFHLCNPCLQKWNRKSVLVFAPAEAAADFMKKTMNISPWIWQQGGAGGS